MAFCMECGAKLNDGDKFCMSCGKPVASAAPPMLEIEPHGGNDAAQAPAQAPFSGEGAPTLADGPTLLQTKPLEISAVPSAAADSQAPFPGTVSPPEMAAPQTKPLEISNAPEVASSAPPFSEVAAPQTKPLEMNDAPAPFSGTPFPGTSENNSLQASAAPEVFAPKPLDEPAASVFNSGSSSGADTQRGSGFLPKADESTPFSNPAPKAPELQPGSSVSADDIFGTASSSSSPKVEVQAASSSVPVFGAGSSWSGRGNDSEPKSSSDSASAPFTAPARQEENESSWPPAVKRNPAADVDAAADKPSLALWYVALGISLLCCCCTNIFSYIGIVYGFMIDKKWKNGDIDGAMSAFSWMKIWTYIAIAAGVMCTLISIGLAIFNSES
ncbi:MAG: zinc-ribbon domain-containing protein [bacterium]|nr:zinc-ribbon domain-containing protein [bacterium]